ncbi:uncharacterized protein LOC123511990 [Portunus trituberculatus]|uniref:uncharacterized protein LOC123511990 n=1 Tax=Portunus trituberculatus TaxID=210409 RepID=UPI001E1D06E8|nr:uncharacterized protein LOC123511990 [Portunus trituberculatus]
MTLEALHEEAKPLGLQVSWPKTKVRNDGGSSQEVVQRIGLAHGVIDSLSTSIWRYRYLCRRTKIQIFKSVVIPVLLYGCETWTLNTDLRRRINVFGNRCLRRIMEYR